jgi:hypothetical protein
VWGVVAPQDVNDFFKALSSDPPFRIAQVHDNTS